MKIREIFRMMKVAILSLVIGVAMMPVPVFADEEYFNASYPPQINNIPGFYITMIDLENNQIELTLNTLFGKEPLRFGVAWIDDRSEEYLNADIRSFSGVDEPWMTKVFWSDDYDLDLESYHSETAAVFLKKYIIDSEVDLLHNTYGDLYYIVETIEGDVWVNKATYGDCRQKWTEGKACKIAYLINDMEMDSARYSLVDAPERYINKNIPLYVEEYENDGIYDLEWNEEDEYLKEEEPEEGEELESEESEDFEKEPESVTEAVDKEGEPEPVSEAANEKIIKIELATIPAIQGAATDTDDEVIEEINIEETGEAGEGFGETTLGVPLLGEIEEKQAEGKIDLTFPSVLLGAGLGAILTLFLLFIIKRAKTLHSSGSE